MLLKDIERTSQKASSKGEITKLFRTPPKARQVDANRVGRFIIDPVRPGYKL